MNGSRQPTLGMPAPLSPAVDDEATSMNGSKRRPVSNDGIHGVVAAPLPIREILDEWTGARSTGLHSGGPASPRQAYYSPAGRAVPGRGTDPSSRGFRLSRPKWIPVRTGQRQPASWDPFRGNVWEVGPDNRRRSCPMWIFYSRFSAEFFCEAGVFAGDGRGALDHGAPDQIRGVRP